MAVRFYVLPIEVVAVWSETQQRYLFRKGPKYLHWRGSVDPLIERVDVHWLLKDYGALDVAIVAADVTETEHITLSAQADVIAFPVDLAETVGTEQLPGLRADLEGRNIPGNWIQAATSYQAIARFVCGLFLYAQAVTTYSGGQPLFRDGDNLDMQIGDFPPDVRDGLVLAAQQLGYDHSGLYTGAARDFLGGFAGAWQTPIKFGKLATL